MSYVDKTLAGGEEVVYRAHFNWTYSFFPVLWFAVGSAPVIMYALMQFSLSPPVPYEELRAGWWFAWIAFGIGSLILTLHLIVLVTTEIVVTTFRFVYKTGLIARNTQEVSLGKIEEVTLKQTVWGRIFGYGKLVIRGTGVGVIELPNLDDPIRVRRIIENAKASLRKETRSDDV
jgi:hypothetical protein